MPKSPFSSENPCTWEQDEPKENFRLPDKFKDEDVDESLIPKLKKKLKEVTNKDETS